jgi:uncharacterized membrane protein
VNEPDDARMAAMDTAVGWTLLAGVAAAASLILAALLWQWIATGSPALAFNLQGRNLAAFLLTAVRAIATPGPRVLAGLGLGVLMLTPYVRVLTSVFFFAVVEHDWKYVGFTSFVAAVLTYSLFLR